MPKLNGGSALNLRNGRHKPTKDQSQGQQVQQEQQLQHQQQQEPDQPQLQQQQQQQATPQKQAMSPDEKKATKKSLVIVAAIFVASLATMCYVYAIFPELNA